MVKTASPLSQRIESLINFDKRIFFAFLVLLFFTIRYLINDIVLKSIPGFEQLEQEGSFTFFHIFNALNYIWTPFSLLWKFTVIAFVIWVGAFAWGYKVSFRMLWQFVLVAEVVFIFPELIKLLYFISPTDQLTLDQIRSFYPLSVLSLVNEENIHPKYYYPLSVLNIFELLYWVLLILGFHTISRRSIEESTLVVLSSYCLCLFVWLAFYILVYK